VGKTSSRNRIGGVRAGEPTWAGNPDPEPIWVHGNTAVLRWTRGQTNPTSFSTSKARKAACAGLFDRRADELIADANTSVRAMPVHWRECRKKPSVGRIWLRKWWIMTGAPLSWAWARGPIRFFPQSETMNLVGRLRRETLCTRALFERTQRGAARCRCLVSFDPVRRARRRELRAPVCVYISHCAVYGGTEIGRCARAH